MDIEKILNQILDFCQDRTDSSQVLKRVLEKIADGTAAYADALNVAGDQGKILEAAFRKFLPEALQDGYLFRAVADTLVKKPVINQTKVVDNVTAGIQDVLNKSARIGIQPIRPKLNQDQLDGIVTGICNVPFEQAKEVFFDQVQNILEGHVDDYVRENADFQYEAGLSPTVTRIADRKCCRWCGTLSGTYEYDEIRNKGNDVWKRHNNCHCIIEFNPGRGSKKKKTKSRIQWTPKDEADRIAYERIRNDLNPIERGYEEARVYSKTWQEGSLQDTVAKFAPNSTAVSDDAGRKIAYKGDQYSVIYDVGGNYFRIIKNQDTTKRPFVDMSGDKVLNIIENGKQRGATKREHEALTHFSNTDTDPGRRH